MTPASRLDHPPARGPRLRDQEARADLEAHGYALVDFLPPPLTVELLTFAEQTVGSSGFSVSTTGRSFDDNLQTSEKVKALIAPHVQTLLAGATVTGCSFVIKEPAGEYVHLHQDWALVDEERASSFNVWCPLVDVAIDNSPLEALPGSHRWFRSFRSPAMTPREILLTDSFDPYLDRLAPAAGQAVVYDARLFHGSRPNRSSARRPVLVFGVVPEGEPTVMSVETPSGAVVLHAVPSTTFLRSHERDVITAASSGPPLRSYAAAPKIDATRLLERLTSEPAPRSSGDGRSGSWMRRLRRSR